MKRIQTNLNKFFLLAGIVLLIVISTGCAVSAGKKQYTTLNSHQVDSGQAATDEVALAFGLDGLGKQHETLTKRDSD